MKIIHILYLFTSSVLIYFLAGCSGENSGYDRNALKKENLVLTEGKQAEIVDHDYCFRIKSPNKKWKLLKEQESNGINPDSVAGGMHSNGIYAVVIIEKAESFELEEYVELLVSTYPDSNIQVDRQDALTFLGQQARSLSMSAVIKEIPFEFQNTIFKYQGFGYQISSWGVEGEFKPEIAAEFLDSFSLIEGKVKARSKGSDVQDMEGVGYRVMNGKFESAVTGIIAESTDSWQVVAGSSLKEMSEDAEVGLINHEKGLYLAFTAERVTAKARNKYARKMVANIEDVFASQGRLVKFPNQVKVTIGGEQINFNRYRVDAGGTYEYLLTVCFVKDYAFQILGWGLQSDGGDFVADISEGLGQIEFMNSRELESLRYEMRDLADRENAVGSDWTLRNGVFKDFGSGFTWAKPRGFWRLQVGDEARSFNEDATFIAHEAVCEFYLMVISESANDFTLAQYNSVCTDEAFDEPVRSELITVAGIDAYSSIGLVTTDGVPSKLMHITLIHKSKAFQIIIWGTPDSMRKFSKEVNLAVDGFKFPSYGLNLVQKTASSYADNRIGFRMRLPSSQWKFSDRTSSKLKPVGTVLRFLKGKEMVQVIGMTMLDEGQDKNVIIDGFLNNFLRINFGNAMKVKPSKTAVSFADLSWEKQFFLNNTKSISFYSSVHLNTIYLIMILGDERSHERMDEVVRDGFRLIN